MRNSRSRCSAEPRALNPNRLLPWVSGMLEPGTGMKKDCQAAVKKHGPSPASSLLWTHTQCWGSGFSDFLVRTGVVMVYLLIKQWQLLRSDDCYVKDWAHNCQIISPLFLLPCLSKAVTCSFTTQRWAHSAAFASVASLIQYFCGQISFDSG